MARIVNIIIIDKYCLGNMDILLKRNFTRIFPKAGQNIDLQRVEKVDLFCISTLDFFQFSVFSELWRRVFGRDLCLNRAFNCAPFFSTAQFHMFINELWFGSFWIDWLSKFRFDFKILERFWRFELVLVFDF